MSTVETNGRAWTRHREATPLAPLGAGPAAPPVPAAPAKTPRPSILWKLFRGTFALGLLALLGWWLLVPLVFPVTSRAVVNARTVQARTPIDGENASLDGEVGEAVAAGHALARVENRRVDTTHLGELAGRVAGLEAERTRLQRELSEARAALPGLRQRVKGYQEAVLAGLNSAVHEASARVGATRIEADGATSRTARLARLASAKVVSGAEMDDVNEGRSRSLKNLEKEQATLTRLQGELAAAKNGVFLHNEASYAQKRADEVDLKATSLEGALKENAERLTSARTQLSQERRRTEGMKAVDVVSPVAGVVWRRSSNVGQVVKQNEVVYEVADRDSIFVEAHFHQRCLCRCVVPGAVATVNLTSGERLRGTVKAVRTLGEGDAEASYAVGLSGGDIKVVRVLIALDDADRDPALIGRHARVLITGQDPTWLERGVTWLFGRLGG